jgi:hypothetical protein
MICKDCPDVTVNRFTAYECRFTGETLDDYLLNGGEPIMAGCPKVEQEQASLNFDV